MSRTKNPTSLRMLFRALGHCWHQQLDPVREYPISQSAQRIPQYPVWHAPNKLSSGKFLPLKSSLITNMYLTCRPCHSDIKRGCLNILCFSNSQAWDIKCFHPSIQPNLKQGKVCIAVSLLVPIVDRIQLGNFGIIRLASALLLKCRVLSQDSPVDQTKSQSRQSLIQQ